MSADILHDFFLHISALFPTHILLTKSCGLERDSLVLTEQIRAIDRSRSGSYIEFAGKSAMSKVDMALSISIGLYKSEEA